MSRHITTLADVKENMQETGDRIRRSMTSITIPIRYYQPATTGERRSGYHLEHFTLETFMDWMIRYYTERGLTNTEPYQHLSAFMNAIILLRDQLTGDLERLYLLIDQASLLQERAGMSTALITQEPEKPLVARFDMPSTPTPSDDKPVPAPTSAPTEDGDDADEEPDDSILDPEDFYT